MKPFFIIIVSLLSITLFSQSDLPPDSISKSNYVADPDQIAKEAVSKIVKYTGLTPNFKVVADEKISTAIAYLKGDDRYIAYNPAFINKLNEKTETNWAAVSVLAHEIGHHFSGHTLLKSSSPGNELIADKFSGFILFKMGASLDEAKAALSAIGHEMDTLKHPPKKARLQAISNGWYEAAELTFTDAYSHENKHTEKSTFTHKCIFKGDDNIYLVDSDNNIIWYNNYGEPIIIGSKSPSETDRYEWIYQYLDNYYGVDSKGQIWKETTYGSIFIVGTAISLSEGD